MTSVGSPDLNWYVLFFRGAHRVFSPQGFKPDFWSKKKCKNCGRGKELHVDIKSIESPEKAKNESSNQLKKDDKLKKEKTAKTNDRGSILSEEGVSCSNF